ncbi:hypothetical protein B484DRAFT_449593 [Ochromonadaceae sp. CCMP2298]|nr:hypothetical protein B484DRAFT_449593 [Ochromonadaceae sp. CCMP2298]
MHRRAFAIALGRRALIVAAVSPVLFGSSVATNASPTDPLNCAIPACSDKISMFKKAMKGAAAKSAPDGKSNPTHASAPAPAPAPGVAPAPGAAHGAGASSGASALPSKYFGCPVDRAELGRSSWDLLHTIAATYPDHPSADDRRRVLALIDALTYLYPCPVCARDFQASVAHSPPR